MRTWKADTTHLLYVDSIHGAFSCVNTTRYSRTELRTKEKYNQRTSSYLDGDTLSSQCHVFGRSNRALECTLFFRPSQDFKRAVQVQGIESGKNRHKHLNGGDSCHAGWIFVDVNVVMMGV